MIMCAINDNTIVNQFEVVVWYVTVVTGINFTCGTTLCVRMDTTLHISTSRFWIWSQKTALIQTSIKISKFVSRITLINWS